MPDIRAQNTDGLLVFAIGPLPPPIQGAAATTSGMLAFVAQHVPLHVANVAAGTTSGLRHHAVKAGRMIRALIQLACKMPTAKQRVLYMAADGGKGLCYNILLAAAARRLGYRIFLHHHSFAYVDRPSKLMAALARVMGPRNHHIVLCGCQADGLRKRYWPFANAPMMELCSSAFVYEQPRLARQQGTDVKLGFLSNLIVEKGLDTSIAVLRAARAADLPVRLVLAGRSTGKRADEIVRAALAEFGEWIEYLGPLSDEQKVAFFHDIDAFIFPTRYVNEAQPRAILESLAYGVPVLTTARGCIEGDVGSGSGICVPPDQDFVESALPLLREWCTDRRTLIASSRQAQERAKVLHQNGRNHLAAIVAAFQIG